MVSGRCFRAGPRVEEGVPNTSGLRLLEDVGGAGPRGRPDSCRAARRRIRRDARGRPREGLPVAPPLPRPPPVQVRRRGRRDRAPRARPRSARVRAVDELDDVELVLVVAGLLVVVVVASDDRPSTDGHVLVAGNGLLTGPSRCVRPAPDTQGPSLLPPPPRPHRQRRQPHVAGRRDGRTGGSRSGLGSGIEADVGGASVLGVDVHELVQQQRALDAFQPCRGRVPRQPLSGPAADGDLEDADVVALAPARSPKGDKIRRRLFRAGGLR
mmetsp:Transcript_93316/g.301895  ORF Transcript_93316/g.301895 Transcript_93316/m.301895 type:complete len:269 (+) Transcript_93316:1078-1884(+)